MAQYCRWHPVYVSKINPIQSKLLQIPLLMNVLTYTHELVDAQGLVIAAACSRARPQGSVSTIAL